ncbi:MAG: excinuclease ABC subunit UvrA [Acidobacteriota bacterium]
MDYIRIKGAREHNLRNLDLKLPKNRLIVITGLSGSGKSSLAFDTLYAEGQRRYVESLSAYARQFLDLMEKPDVDTIEGLSPAISIEQKSTSHNPRSTVGTVTEIYDYLRVLFARVGHPNCPQCGTPIQSQTVQQMVDQIARLPEGERVLVLAPLVRGRKGEYRKLFQDLLKEGFVRARVDGRVADLSEGSDLHRYKAHSIEVVIDRLVIRPGMEGRLTESVELALKKSEGLLIIHRLSDESDRLYSERLSCAKCGTALPELEPRIFSFNSPHGACQECSGIGVKMELDPARVVPNPNLSLSEGALAPWPVENGGWYRQLLERLARAWNFSLKTPFSKLSEGVRHLVLYGTNGLESGGGKAARQIPLRFEGVITNLLRRYKETQSDTVRQEIEGYMSTAACPACGGKRLRPEALAVTLSGMSIADFTDLSVHGALDTLESLDLTAQETEIARLVLKEIRNRLTFLKNVGLGYLTLSRTATTLSGGESQRIRLATQVGSQLTGVLYVLDEPSIGLHQRDNQRLLDTLKSMRDLGNTVVVVEHDEETIREADHIVELGPGAALHRGAVGYRGVSFGAPQHRRTGKPPQGNRPALGQGGRGAQPEGRGCPFLPGCAEPCYGRVRIGEVHPCA